MRISQLPSPGWLREGDYELVLTDRSLDQAGEVFEHVIDTGVIYCDDNLERLRLLPAESVDLIT